MWVYIIMIIVKQAGQLVGTICAKNFNIAIFSDTINMINVRHCMMVSLIELYPFIPLLVTLIVFQGHSSVKQFLGNIFVCIWLSWNFVQILILSSRSWIITIFYFCTCSWEMMDMFPHLEKQLQKNFAFFLDTVKARSSKLFVIMTLLGVYISIVDSMSMTLCQGHRCVRNINCKLSFLDSF